ncbi:MAG: GHMP kinase [Lewinellaceae bacterium]|nr:GHMP kinase [Lewinellaceae bacterium]
MPQSTIFETRANGKLLLSGEYFVLDGATALAMPVRFGQTLQVSTLDKSSELIWESRELDSSIWFEAIYELPYLGVVECLDRSVAEMLASIIRDCQRQNPQFLAGKEGVQVSTVCDFPRSWGLGTSSTIIAAMARWAGVDPYPVLQHTLGGSGYDIACAYADSQVLYKLEEGKPVIRHVVFEPAFSDKLYFVFLNKKQNSREGIARYREKARDNAGLIPEISRLSEQMLNADRLDEFEHYMLEHENTIGKALDLQPVKARLFLDYWGEIKSLGAWGGDFVMATSNKTPEETIKYFVDKGFQSVLRWEEMALST